MPNHSFSSEIFYMPGQAGRIRYEPNFLIGGRECPELIFIWFVEIMTCNREIRGPNWKSNVTRIHGNNMVSNFVISRSNGQLIPISPDTCIPDSRSRGKAGGVSVHLAFKWEKTESSFLHSELLPG